jgi:hypothetical protein
MFPKGKFNTDVSRNAQYLAVFRNPSDRKQIGIVGERMFDKNIESTVRTLIAKRPKNRLDTCWWITKLTHPPISKFLGTYLATGMFISSSPKPK